MINRHSELIARYKATGELPEYLSTDGHWYKCPIEPNWQEQNHYRYPPLPIDEVFQVKEVSLQELWGN